MVARQPLIKFVELRSFRLLPTYLGVKLVHPTPKEQAKKDLQPMHFLQLIHIHMFVQESRQTLLDIL